MGHKLGLKIIAEGIETEWQLQILNRANCDFGQGYSFSDTLPPEEFAALLVFPSLHNTSNINIPSLQCIHLNKRSPWLDIVSHQRGKNLIRRDRVVNLYF